MSSPSDSSEDVSERFESAQEIFPLGSAIIAVVIVLGHAFFSKEIALSWPMVAMLALVAFIPYLPELEWVHVGNMGGIGLQGDVDRLEKEITDLFHDIREETSSPEGDANEELEDEEEPEGEGETGNGGEDLTTREGSYTYDRKQKSLERMGSILNRSTESSTKRSRLSGSVSEGVSPPKFAQLIPDSPSNRLKEFERGLYTDYLYDPKLALVHLRSAVREAEEQYLKSVGHDLGGSVSHGQVENVLKNDPEISGRVVNALNDVQKVSDKAAHGKDVDQETAAEIIELGVGLLRTLEYLSEDEQLELETTTGM